jgi:hypothetical protein
MTMLYGGKSTFEYQSSGRDSVCRSGSQIQSKVPFFETENIAADLPALMTHSARIPAFLSFTLFEKAAYLRYCT